MNEAPDWNLRDATSADLAEISDLTERAYQEFGASVSEESVETFLADARRVHSALEESSLIVAERDGRLVGCVTLYLDGSAYAAGWPSEWPAVRLLAVDPGERGKGIGKALMNECISRARRSGAALIGLHTTPFMVAAQRLYVDMGFQRDPAFDVQYTPDIKVMGYRLQL